MPINDAADVAKHWTSAEVVDQIARALGKGLLAAAVFLAARLREELSVPAPRERVLGKRGKMAGVSYYRATAPAAQGQPPRKLSGRFRATVAWDVPDGTRARVGVGGVQGRRLEEGGHPYLAPALRRWERELGRIIAGE